MNVPSSDLKWMIEDAKKAQDKAGPYIMNFTRRVNNPNDADINTLENELKEFDSLLNDLRSHLLKLNKRIEELLTGEPSV